MKLVEVMASVDRVAKNGNNASQGYKYAQAADVYDAVRAELARRFVLLVPRLDKVEFQAIKTNNDKSMTLCSWFGAFDFTDAETGEVVTVKAFGQGSDSGDKAGYKAITGATKSIIVQMFLIPTGDDPENEGKAGKPQLPPPAGLASVKSKMPQPAGTPSATSGSMGADVGAAFPNYGRLKGAPIHGAPMQDLEYYKSGALKTLNDPAKANFHVKERALLAQIEAEIAAQRRPATGASGNEPLPPGDADAPF